MRRVVPIVSIIAFASPALAQSVDRQGADEIARNLARYIGSAAFDKGIVTVSIEAGAYSLTVDFDKIAAQLPKDAGISFDIDPYTLRVKPLPDGTFAFESPLVPNGSADFLAPAGDQRPPMKSHIEWTAKRGGFFGYFDPALGTVTNAKGSYSAMTAVTHDDSQHTQVSAGEGTVDIKAVKSLKRGVDMTTAQTIADFSEIMTMTTLDGSVSTPVTVKSPKITTDSSATGLQSKAILDLLAFGVAHADQADIAADQAEFKELLLAALPIWDTMKGGYDVTELSVDTPVGLFRVANFGTDISADGIASDGALTYTIDASGFTMPAGIVPPWGQELVPTDLSFSFGVRNLDSEGPARKFIAALDLAKDPPVSPEEGARIADSFMANTPNFVLERSVVRNKDTEIVVSGEMPFPKGKPELSATVEVAGYDKALATLQTAAKSDPTAGQVFPFVLAAKGFAKTLPDGRLQWVVALGSDGSLLVNGTMLKGPDPIEVPMPTP